MSFAQAITSEVNRRATANAQNAAILETLPADPDRGSREFWAALCRENTGQAICDSGIYGYQYTRPVKPADLPPILHLWQGKPEYATKSLIDYLHSIFDADDPTAAAAEKVLYWVGQWLYPRDDWGTVIRNFGDILDLLHSEDDPADLIPLMVGDRHDAMPTYDLQRSQQSLTRDEYVAAAIADFPAEAWAILSDEDVRAKDGWTYYTYNSENDLDQDYMVDGRLYDAYGSEYAIIRSHNGADARGGFSSPVIAAVEENDSYEGDWTVNVYCQECHVSYDTLHYWGKQVEENPPTIDLQRLAALQSELDLQDEIANGQQVIPGLAPTWKHDITPDQARSLIASYTQRVEDFVIEEGDPVYALTDDYQVPEDDTLINARLYCPDCGGYTARLY